MTSSERPSLEPLLKKKRPQPHRGGGENSGNALEASDALNYRVWGVSSRTLERNYRKSSESISGIFPEFFPSFLREVPSLLGVCPTLSLPLKFSPPPKKPFLGFQNYSLKYLLGHIHFPSEGKMANIPSEGQFSL